jgi:TolB-like protein/tetratricopeptide (TPR) repeat protein
MSFWGELKRRNVVKVGIAYAIAAWLIIHPVDIIFPTLHLPEWTTTFVTALFIIAFPFVLIFAWIYEITPEGLKHTKEVPLSKSIALLTGKGINYIITGLLVVAVAYIIFDKFYLDRRAIKTEQVPAVSDIEKAKKTLAVLPFEDLSSESDQRYFVDGLSEEILNSLAQIPDLTVIARTSSFSFKGTNKTIQEIANVLGVDNILEGSVRKAGNALRITAQLVKAVDGSHLWSKTYDRELKDIFAIQEDIATSVTDELKMTLGIGKSFKPLGGTDNMEAYELYMIAKGQHNDLFSKASFNDKEWNHVVELIDSVIALDPGYVLAWALKAKIHIFISVFGPSSLAAAEQDAGLKAALRAVELEPDLADAYASLGIVRIARGELIEGGLAYRKALELTTEPLSGKEYSIATFYLSVGNFKRANELLEEMRQNDPLNKEVHSAYLLSFGFLGDIQQAEKEYEHGRALFGDQWSFGNLYITGLRLGEGDVVSRNTIVFSDPIFDVVRQYLDSREDGLKKLRRYYTNEDNLSSVDLYEISWCAAYFDDPEFAMDVLKKSVSIDATGLFVVWGPVMQETRQLPRFKKFIKEIGLVDYWNKFGWPDLCRPVGDGDFVCD